MRPALELDETKPRIGGRKLRRLVGGTVLLTVVFGAGTVWGQGAEDSRQKYRQAAAFAAEKKHDEARKLFLELWTKTKTYDVAASLGQVELMSRHYPEAASYLSYAVTNFPPHQPEKQLDGLRKWLGLAQQKANTVELTANVKGATVSVDGTEVGKTPLEGPLFLSAGKHLIMVALDGYKTADKSVDGVEGKTERLDFALEATPKSAATSPGPTSNNSSTGVVVQPFQETPKDGVSGSKPNPWILVGGGAVTVGGLVAGFVFNSKANSEYDKADALRDKAGVSGCFANADSGECTAQKRHLEDGDRDRIISGVAFGVGGAALAATVVYWFWPRKTTASTASTAPQLTSSVGPGGGWVGLAGSY